MTLNHRLSILIVSLAASVLLLVGCKREERGFRVSPPQAARIQTDVMQSELQPGAPFPDQPIKNEYEENAYAISEGKTLFDKYNCVGCHFHGGGGIGPPLMDDKWVYGAQPENIFATIVQGRPNGMPSFKNKIPDYQVWQLVAYVRSMSRQVPMDAAPSRDDHLSAKPPEQMEKPVKPVGSGLPKSAETPQ